MGDRIRPKHAKSRAVALDVILQCRVAVGVKSLPTVSCLNDYGLTE